MSRSHDLRERQSDQFNSFAVVTGTKMRNYRLKAAAKHQVVSLQLYYNMLALVLASTSTNKTKKPVQHSEGPHGAASTQ